MLSNFLSILGLLGLIMLVLFVVYTVMILDRMYMEWVMKRIRRKYDDTIS